MSDFWLELSSTAILHVKEQQRFWRAFAGRLCDKYHNLMRGLIFIEWYQGKWVGFRYICIARILLCIILKNVQLMVLAKSAEFQTFPDVLLNNLFPHAIYFQDLCETESFAKLNRCKIRCWNLSKKLSIREKFQGEVLVQIFIFPICSLHLTSPSPQNREKWARVGRLFSPKSPPKLSPE